MNIYVKCNTIDVSEYIVGMLFVCLRLGSKSIGISSEMFFLIYLFSFERNNLHWIDYSDSPLAAFSIFVFVQRMNWTMSIIKWNGTSAVTSNINETMGFEYKMRTQNAFWKFSFFSFCLFRLTWNWRLPLAFKSCSSSFSKFIRIHRRHRHPRRHFNLKSQERR